MNQPVTENNRIEYIDVLRVMSMIFVVFMHTAAGSLRGNIGSATWHISNVLTAMMCTSVPIFFMISGAMLLRSKKTESVSYVYKKRFPKVFVPFVLWSFVAILYFFLLKYTYTGILDRQMITRKLKNIVSEPATVHLWFMYALLPLYMLSPLIKKLVDVMQKNLIKYMLVLWFVFSSVLPTAAAFAPERYKSLFVLTQSYDLNFMGGYLGYFLLGYYLFNIRKRFSKKWLLSIIAANTIIIFLGTWYKTLQLGGYSESFLSYSGIFMVVLSVSVFLFVKEVMTDKNLPALISGIVKFLAAISFGVYLLHNLLVDYISNIIHLWPANSLYDLFLCFFLVLFSSFFMIVILASCKPTCFIFTGLTYPAACKTCNIQFLLRRRGNPIYGEPDRKLDL